MPLLNEGQALTMASKDAATARSRAVRNGERTVPAIGSDLADTEDGTGVSEITGRRLASARALIERDFRRRRLSLSDVAEAAHLSVYHFHRLFRRAYGKTPKQLIEELRVAEVQRLALEGVPFSEVWRVLGYSTQSHMGNRFKQLVGKTPKEWLNSARVKR
jgi:AraC-like DNA-binding protein